MLACRPPGRSVPVAVGARPNGGPLHCQCRRTRLGPAAPLPRLGRRNWLVCGMAPTVACPTLSPIRADPRVVCVANGGRPPFAVPRGRPGRGRGGRLQLRCASEGMVSGSVSPGPPPRPRRGRRRRSPRRPQGDVSSCGLYPIRARVRLQRHLLLQELRPRHMRLRRWQDPLRQALRRPAQ
jgi:hypothetical protein